MSPSTVMDVAEGSVLIELRGAEVVNLSRRPIPDAAVKALEGGVRSGLEAYPDPRRENFFEADFDGHHYYFCVTPSGKVFLLGRWR